jgi:hypothetical protein
MNNAFFWDIRNQFVPCRRHVIYQIQNSAGQCYVRFEVFTAAIMKNAVFWDIKPHVVPQRRHITCPLQSPPG